MTRTIDQITNGRRLRRMRKADWSRRLVQENVLGTNDLVWTIFLCDGHGIREEIPSMPGVHRFSIDVAVEECLEAAALGIPAIAPFSREDFSIKSEDGAYVASPLNLTNRFTSELKSHNANIGIITDAALDPYTTHGHDGILRDGIIINDETVDMVVKGALSQARAGADIIAPSDMMDGRIGAIRDALDAEGFQDVAIISYACKFASAFYGPYRDAIGTAGLLKGDKKTYYIDHANSDEAVREAAQDLDEGADMLMVKPGLPYLDIIYRLKENFSVPLFAYQVSGEYAMMMAAINNGWVDGERIIAETLLSLKRAGCDGILTYFAKDIAQKILHNKIS
ncbi:MULTISPECIES: porphobilinogen synthase [unclassified Bartonella]|uniref:porphobilinogen synthase n=1 Tax=unclassified Bartonella TaxID=2645622 RepID=UPI0021C7869A|nr:MULTISPECIES: porphobilinogen synthase [unclassified Bartonella]UXN04537.1 porphobilinogen synthase [Bartonella sp. HY406]UXN07580.1 porphobilinogen synthase [Bartonella sp. HY761]